MGYIITIIVLLTIRFIICRASEFRRNHGYGRIFKKEYEKRMSEKRMSDNLVD